MPAVDGGGIAAEHLLHEAHALEELAPVERRDQAQAADQVGHRRLFGSLVASFGSNRVLDGAIAHGQRRVELAVQRSGRGAEFARALQQPGHERRVDVRRKRARRERPALQRTRQAIGMLAVRASFRQDVAAQAQVLDQRQLERARPRPQLADRERRDRLERGHEAVQPLRVQAAGAAPDQFERQGVDAGQPGEFIAGDHRQPPEEGRRQVVMDVADGGGNDVVVVEQPFGCGREVLATGVHGERRIDLAQRAGVTLQPSQVRAAVDAPAVRQREQRREPPRVLFERFDAQQFEAAVRQRARRPGSLGLCTGSRLLTHRVHGLRST
jgi:hypothetical protein